MAPANTRDPHSLANGVGDARPTAAIGASIEVEWSDGRRETWTLGHDGDASAGVLSVDAPFARAVLGATVGESRTYAVGDRVWSVLVRRIDVGAVDG